VKLAGKRVLVTGGSRGIGRAVVERLLEEGAAHVEVAADEPQPPLDWAQLEQKGSVSYQVADLATADAPSETVRAAHERMGGLDALLHCAGVYPEGDPRGRKPLELWEMTMNVKARACFLLAHEFAQRAEDGASFVGVSSINAEQSEPDHLAYDPACAALGGVIRAFAVQFAPRFRFNAVAPGLIHTQLTQAVVDDPALERHAKANIPMGRLGLPDDCAGAMAFLLSDESAYITGETLFVDGGIRANQMSKPESERTS